MAKEVESTPVPKRTRRPPAATPEEDERRLTRKAIKVAEQQMDDGTVSAQVLTHYLKMNSSREKLEQERIQMEIELGRVKKETLESVARAEELMEEALEAFTSYSPTRNPEIPPHERNRDR